VDGLRSRELLAGLSDIAYYERFRQEVEATKRKLLRFLIDAKESGNRVAGYGAPGKGNTLLNYCGIRTDLLDFTVDMNPHKQEKFLPGSHIPIFHPDKIFEAQPDYILVLPWNLRAEIAEQLAGIRSWGGQLVVPIPEVGVIE
jgi:hypothetical protein